MMTHLPRDRAVIDLWERGRGRANTARALALLGAALPDRPAEELAALSVGRRDGLLLEASAGLLGPVVAGLASCPACGESVETSFRRDELTAADRGASADPVRVAWEGYDCLVRPPDSLDVAAVADDLDDPRPDLRLLGRCLIEARRGDEPLDPGDLPEGLVAAIETALSEADPLADVWIRLDCPACGHGWPASFDVVEFVWAELEARAFFLMREVARLALAFGWSEAEILGLSPARRRLYLDLAASGEVAR